MSTVKSYAANSVKAPLTPYSFDRREPRAGDVVIDIHHCGICHSDIHQARDEWGGSIFPMVPGHEIAGTVVAVGSGVQKFKAGDHVGVGCMVDSCGKCEPCRAGLQPYCEKGCVFTYNSREYDGTPTMGGYSERVVVDQNFVVRIPSSLSLAGAAPLLCAGITMYSPLKHWNAGPNKRVAILGLGGLGHMGVKLAHAMGAEVTVLSHSMRKEQDARRMGADHFYSTADEETFKKQARSYDLILNTVSAEIDWNAYLNLLRLDGSMVVVGLPGSNASIAPFMLLQNRRSVAGSMIGGIPETQEMLDFCGKHNIECDIEKIPIQDVNEAYERILKSDVRYRFVIDMESLKAS